MSKVSTQLNGICCSRRVMMLLLGATVFATSVRGQSNDPLLIEEPASETTYNVEFAPQVNIPVTVTLKEQATCQNSRLFFEDIANCAGSTGFCEELASVDFGESPKPGSNKNLTRELVQQILKTEFPNAEITLSGATRVIVQGSFQEINQEVLRSYFHDALASSLASNKNVRIEQVQVRLPRALRVLPGEFTLRFPMVEQAVADRLDWIETHYSGPHSFEVHYEPQDSQNQPQSLRFSAQVSLSLLVPVTKYDVPRGTMISHEILEYQWVPLAQRGAGWATEIADIVGLKAAQTIRAGQAIGKKQLVMPTLVKRGDIVSLLIRNGDLVIRGRGKAMSSGSKDQRIPIVYPSTKKQVQGRVTGQDQVEVML